MSEPEDVYDVARARDTRRAEQAVAEAQEDVKHYRAWRNSLIAVLVLGVLLAGTASLTDTTWIGTLSLFTILNGMTWLLVLLRTSHKQGRNVHITRLRVAQRAYEELLLFGGSE